jgi:hypothetical protein
MHGSTMRLPGSGASVETERSLAMPLWVKRGRSVKSGTMVRLNRGDQPTKVWGTAIRFR